MICDRIFSNSKGCFMARNETKTKFERNLELAQENDKIVYYDYISYKRAAGWWTGLRNDDWNRPTTIQKAKYNGEFLYNLSDYYFLGFPIKELLKRSYANGSCHACAIALSLYFKNFEIITCNLKNYAEHYTIKSKNSFYGSQELDEFEHTFLLVELDGRKTVIDTTFGFITDYETYKLIFNPNKIRTITSEQLKNVEPYQYIKSLKNYKIDLKYFHHIYIEEKNEWVTTEEEIEFDKIIHSYMNMCKNYTNNENLHLQDFMNRCLFRTSNSTSHWHWRNHLEYGKESEYPQMTLLSLEDDEFDERLGGVREDTIERNKRVLENYHKEQTVETKSHDNSFKSKILKLVRTLKNN